MWSCLLLALALLGTVPVSRSALASPVVKDEENVTELEVPKEYSGCLGAKDKQAPGVPSMPSAATCRYTIITCCRTFHQAQRVCAQRYHGRLASIHDCHTNNFLQLLACQHTNSNLVWIGAVSRPAVPYPSCHWTDGSPWNYNNWMPGHPLPGHCFCSALCIRSGLWKSVPCQRQLPFICEI